MERYLLAKMKIVLFHIYNLFQFSYVKNNYEVAFEKSKSLFKSHLNNLIIIFLVYPVWILFDFNKYIKEYIGTNKYDIKYFFIILIAIIVVLSYSKYNPLNRFVDNFFNESIVMKSNSLYENTPEFITYSYRLVFVFGNFLFLILMFFVELKIFG